MTKIKTFNILKLKIQDIIHKDYKVTIKQEDEHKYIIKQQDTPLFRQISMVRGFESKRIHELIFVEAKHNKKRVPQLQKLLREGFIYNSKRYVRFGKSSSQAKDGITVFIDNEFYDEIMERSQLGVDISQCVISKYESYRCLILSSCQFIHEEKLPYIVLVDEFEKVLPNQYVRYATTKDIEYVEKNTGEVKTYKNQRVIEEGKYDIKTSPFDGFGVHTEEMSKVFGEHLNTAHTPIGYQIRLPFLKGMSIQAPIREFYEDIGVKQIKDIFGVYHEVDKIDCIWNTSMWKAYGMFREKFGNSAWNEYMNRVEKYGYKIGISKFSHHKDDIKIFSRLNFQYLQCLDLLNEKYINQFKNKEKGYDILNEKNWGKIINLAKYSTDLLEKIIKGDKFYTLKFLGLNDPNEDTVSSKYVQAALINDSMLKDPCIRNMLKRRLDKTISQMKYGKIYAEGFYHTVVGDIIGYLEYCAEKEVKGCIDYGEFYAKTIPFGDCLSMRSPLVDPSEVNKVKVVTNEMTEKYLSHFENQDICMINLYDLSLAQQGGMDTDGDSVYLCYNPILVDSKIDSPIVVDVEDKKAAKPVEYNIENIINYECNSRDNRIGEITNIATSILNQYTEDDYWKKVNADNVSILRLYQGKEIDFIKTGFRWVISKNLRKYLKRLPYFLLHNYPKKLNVYNKIKNINKRTENENRIPYNAYRSPSPLNELCDYISMWEKHRLIWDKSVVNNGQILINRCFDLSNKHITKQIKAIYNQFKTDMQRVLDEDGDFEVLLETYREKLSCIQLETEHLANYCISVSYRSISEDKVLCWNLFGDEMIKNLRNNSPDTPELEIIETEDGEFKFLGKYYSFKQKTREAMNCT